ncbi:MAG: hypothetical protein HYY37_03480 [Candidatus Aenigmarchaeota archaeon]|nr:hypothetical protein [Candidatus Aenigmarchaeota archaeon]
MNISLVNDAQTWGIQVDGLDSDKFKIVDFQPDPDVTVMTFVKSTGNVGIGTTGPGDMLHIYSTSGAGTAGLTIQSTVADSYPGIDLKNDARSWNIAADGTTSDALVFYDITAAQYRMVINTDGNLGIGTTSPSERLHVAGNMTITENLTVQRNLTVQHNLSVGGSTLYVNSAAGRVGIGTGTPAAPLHIQKDGSGEVTQLQLDDSTAKTWSTTVRDMIYMESRYTGQVLDYSTANINWGYTDTFQNNGATLAFDIVDSTGSWKNTVTIKGSGNVGIGDTTPNQALDVAGSINFTGRITSDPNSGTGGFGNLIASGTGDASGSFKIDANEIGVVYLYSWTNGNDHGRISSYLVGGASSNVYSATIADTGAADVTHSVSLSGTGDHTVTYTMTDDTASEVLDGWRVYYMKIGGD